MRGLSQNPFFDRTFALTSATSGLGPDMARALVAEGARLVAIDRAAPALARLRDGLGAADALDLDLSEPSAPLALARWLADEGRDLGGLVCNCAAGGSGSPFAALSLLGLLPRLLPGRQAPKVALLLPVSPAGRDVMTVSERIRALGWNRGSGGWLTAVGLPGGYADAPAADRDRAARAILRAMAAGRPALRLRPPALPGTGRGDRTASDRTLCQP